MPAGYKQYVNPWTDANVATLKSHWASGLSASKIAAAIGGVTRNAVIGKASRLKLPGRITTQQMAIPRRQKRIKPLSFKKPKPDAPTAEEILATSLPPDQSPCAVTLMQLAAHTCRWPIDSPSGQMMYCGAKPTEDSPYCRRHDRLAYHSPPRLSADEQARRAANGVKMFAPLRSRVA